MPSIDLAPLREFGAEAERKEFPCINVGGFIVPGNGPARSSNPGKEHSAHATERHAGTAATARQEVRSAAGPRQRSSPAAATGTAKHAVRSRLDLPSSLRLEELDYWHPEARLLSSSSSSAVLQVPVGLFESLPYRARLTLEIPLSTRHILTPSLARKATPDVRAWATWAEGPRDGWLITSHHQNPDLSICGCREWEWLLRVHALVDYINICIAWIGKVLHEEAIGFWPGPQHYGPFTRARRNRPDEYCGCGEPRRYRDCCMEADFRKSSYDRWVEQQEGAQIYLADLDLQGRSRTPPLNLGVQP